MVVYPATVSVWDQYPGKWPAAAFGTCSKFTCIQWKQRDNISHRDERSLKRSLNIIWLYHYQSGLSSWSTGVKARTTLCVSWAKRRVYIPVSALCLSLSWRNVLAVDLYNGWKSPRAFIKKLSAGLSHFLLISILHIAAGSKHNNNKKSAIPACCAGAVFE